MPTALSGIQNPSSLTLGDSRGGPTASLGSLCQGFTNFILKNFLLTPSLNLSFFLSLEPFILVLSQKTQLESNPLLSHSPSLGTGGFLEGSGHTLSLQHLGWDRSP